MPNNKSAAINDLQLISIKTHRRLGRLRRLRRRHLLRHVQVMHHSSKPIPFLLQLDFQLRDHLHLDSGLRRRSVVQRVFRV